MGRQINFIQNGFAVPLDTQHEEVKLFTSDDYYHYTWHCFCGIDQDRGDILVHALSTDDPDAEIQTIKARYEQPLIQIFGVDTGESA